MSIAAETVAYGYGRRVIGRDVTLVLEPGEAVALLGPNGHGKTTLLKTLLGLIPPLAGSVRLDGKPLAALGAAERARRIAYVPQAHAGSFAFTVAEIVLMGRTAHAGVFAAPTRHDRAVSEAAIERLGIGHLAARPYTEISGGERQLALVARALAQEPAYILLDEPTASLDFGNQGRVMSEVERLAQAGLGVLFTTHDPNQALASAGRAILLRDGAAIAEGKPDSLLTRERLEALYAAPVAVVGNPAGARAFVPGR